MEAWGGSCEQAFAEEYLPEMRESLAQAEIDESELDLSADVVVIPDSAVTFGGEPSTDGDTTLIERDGKWWIS